MSYILGGDNHTYAFGHSYAPETPSAICGQLDNMLKLLDTTIHLIQPKREILIFDGTLCVQKHTNRKIAGWKNDTPLYCEETTEIEETEPVLQKHTEWKLLTTGGYALISTEREVLRPKLRITSSEYVTIPRGFDVQEIFTEEREPLSDALLEALRSDPDASFALKNAKLVLWGARIGPVPPSYPSPRTTLHCTSPLCANCVSKGSV
jgi:hypothetical protein